MHNGKPPVEGEYWWDERGNEHYWYRYEDGTIDEGGSVDAEMIERMLADAPKHRQRVHVWSIEGPWHEEADGTGGQEAAADVCDVPGGCGFGLWLPDNPRPELERLGWTFDEDTREATPPERK